MSDARVIEGNCIEVMASLDAESIDAIVTDPPYNLSFMAKPWDCHGGREDAGFAYWLSGLIDGEGCFTIKAHTRGTHAPCFTLKLRADERATLDLCKRTLGIGKITDEKRDPNPMVGWSVHDKTGCQRLVDLLDKYPLRAKKRIDYMTWREAVCEWTSRPRGNRWHGSASNERMANLRARLMSDRAYTDIPWSGHGFQDWCRLWSRECLRVAKPGAHLVAFGGTRTYHRLACALEDAGWEIRDSLMWIYGSGFPKSHNLKGDREGWGTALKPAHEPIVLARKPLAGTVAANVEAHGTGALNVDGCRVPSERLTFSHKGAAGEVAKAPKGTGVKISTTRTGEWVNDAGRWPPNVLLGHSAAGCMPWACAPDCPVAEMDRQSDRTTSPKVVGRGVSSRQGEVYGRFRDEVQYFPGYGDSGGASRFFPQFLYTAKASTGERNKGLESLPRQIKPQNEGAKNYDDDVSARWRSRMENIHPTVKPLDLMRWLCRLVTPPGGLILDPFLGSGTTAIAALREGFRCVGIEREPEYVEIARRRIEEDAPLFNRGAVGAVA